jgi:hypothetical protein
VNPAFTGPVILGKPSQWFDPNAFLAPPVGSGFSTARGFPVAFLDGRNGELLEWYLRARSIAWQRT